MRVGHGWVPRQLVVLVDTREKFPITFPRWLVVYTPGRTTPHMVAVKVKSTRLKSGDYCLQGYKRKCIIERKASLDELYQNLFTADWRRQEIAFERLQKAAKKRVLLIDAGIGDLMKYAHRSDIKAQYELPDPGVVLDRIMYVCKQYRMSLWMIGGGRRPESRTWLGAMVLRKLLAEAVDRGMTDRQVIQQASALVGLRKKNAKVPTFSEQRSGKRGTLRRTGRAPIGGSDASETERPQV